MKRKNILLIIFLLTLFIFQHVQASPDTPIPNLSPTYAYLDHVWLYVLKLNADGTKVFPDALCFVGDTDTGCAELNYSFPSMNNPVYIDIESAYLPNVLPREMDVQNNDPTLIALQSQAIAARTYATWTALNKSYPDPFGFGYPNQINNSTDYQFYSPDAYDHYLNPNDPNGVKQMISTAITTTSGIHLTTNGVAIDSEFGSDIDTESEDEPSKDYLDIVQDPISTTCGAVTNYSGWGMSQKGALRWSKGNQCATGGDTSNKWPVTWTDYRQILVHYYTGIDILNASGGKIAPDDRWNLLWHDNFGSPIGSPLVLTSEGQYNISLILQNTSTSEWNGANIEIGYHWGDQVWHIAPNNLLPNSYPKGKETETFIVQIVAPSTNGIHTLHLDLRHKVQGQSDNLGWFSLQSPAWPDAQIEVQVTGAIGCTHWDIASDFRISPNHINPNPDSCGNAGVWEFMGSGNPNYQLPTFTSNISGYTGLDFWFGTHIDGNGSFPAIGFNGSGETRVFGAITFPVNAVNIHPAPAQSGVIAWHSPVSGHVSISGGVSDNDPACGNGIVWYLDKNTIDLASGGIVNGGSQSFANGSGGTELGTVEVNIGDTIYLAIHSNGDYFCDNTKVDFIVDVTNAPPTATPLGGPTSTSFPPNYTPPPSTETPFPTPTPPTIQPTSSPYVQCYCVIDFLVYLEIELPCWFLGSNNLKVAAPLPVFQSTEQAILDVQLFHRVEDEILSQTPQGEEYIALYYEYSPEIIQILYNDPTLKQEAIAVLQMWESNLQALVDGNGSTVTITNTQVQAAQTFLNNLSAQASPELQQVIANEQIQQPLEQFSGVTMAEALAEVNTPVTLTPTITSTVTPTITPTPTSTTTPTFTPSLTATPTFTPAPDLIFADGFESGNFSAWDGANIDGGDLSVTTSAAYQSGFGLQARLDDTVNLKAVDFSPAKETRYRARFYFHPNSIAMNAGSAHFIFDGFNQETGSAPLFRLELIYENGTYKLRQHVITDNNVYAKGIKIAISNDWHAVEIEWNKASTTGANDGAMSLWVEGALVDVISNVDNDSAIHLLEKIYLGATGSIDPTTSGSMFFDDFISHRETFIGQ